MKKMCKNQWGNSFKPWSCNNKDKVQFLVLKMRSFYIKDFIFEKIA